MTEEELQQEVLFYQETLKEAVARLDPQEFWHQQIPELFARFNTLKQEDFTHFRRLALWLLADERPEIRLGAIKLLQLCKTQDDLLSMALVHLAIKYKEIRSLAFSALTGIRTRRVLPQLFLFAEKGYSRALEMIRPMLQTPEEIERGIAISRTYIDAKEYRLREAALFLLRKYSSMDDEAERIFGAVQKYMDELFIAALKDAPPEKVLEPLKALRSTFEAKHGKNYGEYEDMSYAIDMLEKKQLYEKEQRAKDALKGEPDVPENK